MLAGQGVRVGKATLISETPGPYGFCGFERGPKHKLHTSHNSVVHADRASLECIFKIMKRYLSSLFLVGMSGCFLCGDKAKLNAN